MTHDSNLHAGAGLGARLLLTVALGLLLGVAWRRVDAVHQRRHGGRHERLPRRLQRWEGEGGRPGDDDDLEPEIHPEPTPRSPGTSSRTH